MANRYYGVSQGESKATVSTSTTSKNTELVVLQGAINSQSPLTRQDMLDAIEYIKQAVLEDKVLGNV
jgi:hypothetical protein